MRDDLTTQATDTAESDELYEMASLYPRTTGLPMTVWVGPRGNARHDLRVKVNMTHGNQMNIDNTAVVGVRPSPHMIAGRLSAEDERAVAEWIELNAAAIIAYWDGDTDTLETGSDVKAGGQAGMNAIRNPLSRNAGEGGERSEPGEGLRAPTLTHLTLTRQVPPVPHCGRG
jgi:hypothetical protein